MQTFFVVLCLLRAVYNAPIRLGKVYMQTANLQSIETINHTINFKTNFDYTKDLEIRHFLPCTGSNGGPIIEYKEKVVLNGDIKQSYLPQLGTVIDQSPNTALFDFLETAPQLIAENSKFNEFIDQMAYYFEPILMEFITTEELVAVEIRLYQICNDIGKLGEVPCAWALKWIESVINQMVADGINENSTYIV